MFLDRGPGVRMAGRFLKIKNQTFSHDGVKQSLQDLGDRGFFHEIPHQESVVQVHKGHIGAVNPGEAFQPPVKGVQGMGMVASLRDHALAAYLLDQPGFSVNADVAAGGVVIRPGQFPAKGFRPEPWHSDHKCASGFEHPDQLFKGRVFPGNMFHDLRADHSIKAVVFKGQLPYV